jgi:hypothetical protein
MLLLKFNNSERSRRKSSQLKIEHPSIGFSQNLSIQNNQSIFPQSSVTIRVIRGKNIKESQSSPHQISVLPQKEDPSMP